MSSALTSRSLTLNGMSFLCHRLYSHCRILKHVNGKVCDKLNAHVKVRDIALKCRAVHTSRNAWFQQSDVSRNRGDCASRGMSLDSEIAQKTERTKTAATQQRTDLQQQRVPVTTTTPETTRTSESGGTANLVPTDKSPHEDVVSQEKRLSIMRAIFEKSRVETVAPPDEDSHDAIQGYSKIREMEPGPLLHMILTEHQTMNRIHVALVMRNLFHRGRHHEEKEKYRADVINHPGFQVLIGLLGLHSQYYKPEVCADMLKFLRYFGLDSDHPTVQVYLELAKSFINDVTLDRLINVAVNISELSESHQTATLLEGLKVLVPLRVNTTNIPTLNAWELVHLFDKYYCYLNQVQRDCVIECLGDFDTLRALPSGYAVPLLDGARKASQLLRMESPQFTRLCMRKLHYRLKTTKLNVDEMLTCLSSCIELNTFIWNWELYTQLRDQILGLVGDITVQDKLEMLHLLKKMKVSDSEIIYQYLPDIIRHKDELSTEEKYSFMKVCSDTDWSELDASMRRMVVEACQHMYIHGDETYKTHIGFHVFAVETLTLHRSDEARAPSIVKNMQRAKDVLNVRLKTLDDKAPEYLRSLLPSAIKGGLWNKDIQVDFLTEGGILIDFLVTEKPREDGQEPRRLAVLSVKRPYHHNTGRLRGLNKSKQILLENEGYLVCHAYDHLLISEGNNASSFLRKLIKDTIDGGAILDLSNHATL